ncbi:Scr1 family TA system antitoxin-like transcriptional regulator [Streptomyces catenulae]|uniref:Scr1 family TA system antitoxin-like transcriptional regulator n=1 Tax=Streptomyces catenulae TaxID=66875 RepID=A0ABV2Z6N0_9ACTN|nr:Scr1 family TA system antitoxin-like transcriptional regulator [Streptomyces catenulae]
MPEISEFKKETLRELGRRLREVRLETGSGATELARRVGWSPSKCSRIESGKRTSTTVDDVATYLAGCGAEDKYENICGFLREAEGRFREWAEVEKSGLNAAQQEILPLWESTRQFRAYAGWVLPGPLQTREYALTILQSLRERRGLLPDDAAAAATRREYVQKYLADKSKSFELVIEESVLRRGFGDPQMSLNQLMRLLDVRKMRTVQLGIIPARRDVCDRSTVWPAEDFWIFDDDRVKLELVSSAVDLSTPYDLEQYGKVFTLLQEQAVYGTQAVEIVKAAMAMVVKQWHET